MSIDNKVTKTCKTYVKNITVKTVSKTSIRVKIGVTKLTALLSSYSKIVNHCHRCTDIHKGLKSDSMIFSIIMNIKTIFYKIGFKLFTAKSAAGDDCSDHDQRDHNTGTKQLTKSLKM